MSLFLRLLEDDDKAEALRTALRALAAGEPDPSAVVSRRLRLEIAGVVRPGGSVLPMTDNGSPDVEAP